MSFSIAAVSSNNTNFDAASTPKLAPKPTEADQIKQLAAQGHSAAQIATTVGLPESIVAEDLGTTTSTTTSTTSQASALLALGARLSVHA
jgi:hypothetical protein